MDTEQKTTQEATLSFIKFIRLLRVRLVTQGLKATLWWSFNLFNRLILDRPLRGQCQVTPQLFVGAQFRQRGWQVLHRWGITGVVNMRSEFDDLSLGVDIPAYLALPTRDDDAPSLENLERGVAFIRQEFEKGGKVYIHCGAGVGRAPTMAAAYLVTTGLTPEQAYETIRKQRIFIRPTRVQREQLQRFADLAVQGNPTEAMLAAENPPLSPLAEAVKKFQAHYCCHGIIDSQEFLMYLEFFTASKGGKARHFLPTFKRGMGDS